MATVLGPFFGDDPHEALADAVVRVGAVDITATLTAIAGEPLAWRAVVSRSEGPGLRVVLSQGGDGWVVAIGGGDESDRDLLAISQTALAHLAAQLTDEAANSGG